MNQKRRRTKAQLEIDVMEAVYSSVLEVGFSNITLVGIAERSKTGSTNIYDNFGNLESVLNLFADKYRFWFLSAVAHATSFKDQTDVNYIKNLISKLLNESFDNKIVSQILRCELSDNNTATEKVIHSQEAFYKTIYYNQSKVRAEHPDAHILLALLVGGIYYTALIKDRSSFWGADFRCETNRNKLQQMVNNVLDKMLSDNQPVKEVPEIARKLKVKGIDIQTIVECTGLSLEQVEAL